MPEAGELPDDLKALVRRNALEIGHIRFDADSEHLITAVERALQKARDQREAKENERLGAEQRERLDREQTERAAAELRERKENEQLDARRREQERLDHESQSQPLSPVLPVASSTPPAKIEAESFSQTPKVVHPVPPEPEKPPPPSSGGNCKKSSVEAGNRSFGDRGVSGGRRTHLPRYQTIPVPTAFTRADCSRNSKSDGNRRTDTSGGGQAIRAANSDGHSGDSQRHANKRRNGAQVFEQRHERSSVGKQFRNEICACGWNASPIQHLGYAGAGL
jgi:hypothetical protein